MTSPSLPPKSGSGRSPESWLSCATDQQLLEIEQLLQASPLDGFRADPALILSAAGKAADPWQAELLRGDRRQALLCCSRQSGKSTTAAALALKTALLSPGSLVLLLSPTLRQSGELFRDKVRRLYQDLGRPVPTTGQDSALGMELANGSRIISLPGDEGTIRGYSGVALLVIDEAARVSDDLYRAVRPMLAVSGGRLVALSTPFGRSGWFAHEWHGEGPWERVRITARECPRIPAEFLEEERRAMGQDWFDQEYDCQFIEGGSDPLFPSNWLERAHRLAAELKGRPRRAKAIGIDPGEGVSNTTMAAVDEYGLIELASEKTPDTAVTVNKALAFIRRHQVPANMVAFDRGGGGQQHADQLRERGWPVRTVAFGETVTPEPKRGLTKLSEVVEQREERYVYKNRRAQMYGELSLLLDPHGEGGHGFAIPAEYAELRRQMAPIPRTYDPEGRLYILPKTRRSATSTEKTLTELIGCSPDELDAVVLAVHALLHREKKIVVGAM